MEYVCRDDGLPSDWVSVPGEIFGLVVQPVTRDMVKELKSIS